MKDKGTPMSVDSAGVEKYTVTPTLTITAEECRQNAMHYASRILDYPSNPNTDWAVIGQMWATLGQLCIALGDPDNARTRRPDITVNVADYDWENRRDE